MARKTKEKKKKSKVIQRVSQNVSQTVKVSINDKKDKSRRKTSKKAQSTNLELLRNLLLQQQLSYGNRVDIVNKVEIDDLKTQIKNLQADKRIEQTIKPLEQIQVAPIFDTPQPTLNSRISELTAIDNLRTSRNLSMVNGPQVDIPREIINLDEITSPIRETIQTIDPRIRPIEPEIKIERPIIPMSVTNEEYREFLIEKNRQARQQRKQTQIEPEPMVMVRDTQTGQIIQSIAMPKDENTGRPKGSKKKKK